MQMYDDMEIPELTAKDFKRMKPNPYASKFSNEEKLKMILYAFMENANITKDELKREVNLALA